jgi:hypothetical protein
VRSRISQRWVAAWAIFATYVVTARGVGNLFPFSVFDMYQRRPAGEAARIVAIDDTGAVSELSEWTAFACEGGRPVLTDGVKCGREDRAIPYVTRDQQRYLDAHTGEGGPAHLSLVSRSYVLSEQGGALRFSDCLLARCAARRAP